MEKNKKLDKRSIVWLKGTSINCNLNRHAVEVLNFF